MKSQRLADATRTVLIGFLACWCGVVTVSAEERHTDFLEGLRDRGLHDYALYFLDQLEARPDTPPVFKEQVPFEKALIAMHRARLTRNYDDQTRDYDTARGFLEQFIKASPDHPKAAQANSELAQVYIGRGRAEVLQAKSLGGAAKADMQAKARATFALANTVADTALKKYEARYKEFPLNIDTKDKAKVEARDQALLAMVQAQLNVATVKYEEAQSYDKTAPEWKQRLTEAAEKFNQIQKKNRSLVAGLYAQMWEAKCLEEMDEHGKAIGIYTELLSQPAESRGVKALQERAFHFKLISLNKKNDYQTVITEANGWLKTHPPTGAIALGVQWELARALDLQAGKEAKEADKTRLMNQAYALAEKLARQPGEFREPANSLLIKLKKPLKKDSADPKDYDGALSLAQSLLEDIAKKSEAVATAADAKEKARLQDEYQKHLKETARVCQLALQMYYTREAGRPQKVDDKEKEKQQQDLENANALRQSLAYVYFSMPDHQYDAAVLGEYVARKYADTDKENAQGCANIALAAYMKTFAQAKEDSREADFAKVVEMCKFITTKWSGTDKANDAWFFLGGAYQQMKRYVDAAEAFSKVPDNYPKYIPAQLNAGQGYWSAYLDASLLPEGTRPPKEKLQEYQTKALDILRKAITTQEAKLPADAAPEPTFIAAKLSAAQMLNTTGDHKGAAEIIAKGSHSLVAVVAFDPEKDCGEDKNCSRPQKGIKSKAFAGEVYRQLVRAYIGTQQLDQAREGMKELEKIEGEAGSENVMKIYLTLGNQLRKEVERLQATKDTRLNDVLKSFESFLDELSGRKDGQTFQSLSWVAETFVALGEGLEAGDAEKSKPYFAKAGKAYETILDRASKEKDFIKSGLSGLQLRYVNCKRREKDFEAAKKVLMDVLKTKPKALDAQIEAARLYQDWAAQGGPNDAEKWTIAIVGEGGKTKKDKLVWGWYDIGERVAQSMKSENPAEKANAAEYAKLYPEVRYNVAYCRFKSALTKGKTDDKLSLLNAAKRDLYVTATLADKIDPEVWDKMNSLYRDVQKESGSTPVVDLQKFQSVPDEETPPEGTTGNDVAANGETKTTDKKPKKEEAKPSPESEGTPLWVGLLVIVGGVAGAAVFLLKKKKPTLLETMESHAPEKFEMPTMLPQVTKTAAAPDFSSFGGPATATAAPPKRRPLPATAGGATAAPGTAPAAASAGAAGAPAPKPAARPAGAPAGSATGGAPAPKPAAAQPKPAAGAAKPPAPKPAPTKTPAPGTPGTPPPGQPSKPATPKAPG